MTSNPDYGPIGDDGMFIDSSGGELSEDDSGYIRQLAMNDEDNVGSNKQGGSSDEDLDYDISDISDIDFVATEDNYQDVQDVEDYMEKISHRRGKKKKSKPKSKEAYRRQLMDRQSKDLDPEVLHYLALGNELFATRKYHEAIGLYEEVIKKHSKCVQAYRQLGTIYKELGQTNKCCNVWLIAAELQPWDSELWGIVAELSNLLGHYTQAIYCYGKAISADNNPTNTYFIYERAMLYKKTQKYGRALEGLQKVHQINPLDSNVIKQLASIYADQGRLNDGLNLYMRIFDQNMDIKNAHKKVPKFEYDELNVLAELYMRKRLWNAGVKVIRMASRWLQNRTDETWWDEKSTVHDYEFDERRFEILQTMPSIDEEVYNREYKLPIDIRHKLGYIRLEKGDKDEAMIHFNYLFDEEEVDDLLFDAGKVLEANGYYKEALEFLTQASMCEGDDFFDRKELNNLLGKCFLEVEDYAQAKEVYQILLKEAPHDVNIKLALVEALFYLNETEESQNLLMEIEIEGLIEEENDTEQVDNEIMKEDKENQEKFDNLSLIKNKHFVTARKDQKLSEEAKAGLNEIATRKVLEKYRRMERLEKAMQEGNEVATNTWMYLASQLIDVFMNVPSFFPRDKNRTFKGIVLYKRKTMGIDDRLARIYNLHEGMTAEDPSNSTRLFLTATVEFRGITYNQWFLIFVQYALLLESSKKDPVNATHIVEVAMSVSVFVQDKSKDSLLKLVRLVLGVHNEDFMTVVMNFVRHFLSGNQFSPFIYKFFLCCFSSGIEAWEAFSNYNHQKYFLRQLKAFDSITTNKSITGMATITAPYKLQELGKEHGELSYVYASLLGGYRTYIPPIVYLNRAYRHYNKDPTICLALGLAHVHRSMQRLSANRHLQLLQGISYILEYRQLRLLNATVYEQQEIEFNMAKLFHMLGLTNEAIVHYNKVIEYHDDIEDIDHDLLMEAVFNLTLIYNINGNSSMARDLSSTYLVIE